MKPIQSSQTKHKGSITPKENLLGQFEEKKPSFAYRKTEDFVGNLNSFRDDLRKQITEKLKSSSKIIDISSPRPAEGNKLLFGTKQNEPPSPLEGPRSKISPLSTKSSEKKIELNTETNKKRGIDSLGKNLSKTSDNFIEILERKRESQRISIKNTDTNSFFNEQEKRGASPSRDLFSGTDYSSANPLKRSGDRNSFLETRSFNKTPKDSLKEDLNKILEGGSRTPVVSKETRILKKVEQPNPIGSLTQEIARLRQSRSNLLSNLQEKQATPKHNLYGSESKSNSNYFNETIRDTTDKNFYRTNLTQSITKGTQDNFFGRDESAFKEKSLIDQLPLSKLYEIQDLFYNISDREFNELSSEQKYVEELIKLSSVIMHRVKNSSYYTKGQQSNKNQIFRSLLR